MRRMRHLSIAGLVFLLGCGGSTATVGENDGGADAASGDASSSDAGSDSASSDGGACSPHVPRQNRSQGAQCPVQRGAGVNGSGPPGSCTMDSDCTSGRNGRCLSRGFGAQILQCSYDECTVDSDCPGNLPCDCRDSDTSTEPNVCGTGSNCRVNGDCGPCGFCSPSEAAGTFCFGRNTTYYCHTPSDTCVDDTDCGADGSCNLDPTTHHWACVTVCSPPPP